jgi:uncharacterized protein DUF3891
VIVRQAGERVQLITQPDHAHLSGRVMEHCVPLSTHPRRREILHAVGEHDNGWTEEDAAPSVNLTTGQIFDFVAAPASVRQSVWPRGIARLATDPWAAALVAQHAITVYDRFRSDSEWAPFFAGMEASRDAMLRASERGLDILLPDYVFVRLADLISLAFCVGWKDEQRFGEWTVQCVGDRVIVRPDAFGRKEIPIEIDAREISNRPFQSDMELRDALREASVTTLKGVVSGIASAT